MKYICNGFKFTEFNEAVKYAEFYRVLTGIFLGIEEREGKE